MEIKLEHLRKAAMNAPGLFQAALEAGELRGEHLLVSRENWDKLNDRFFHGIAIGSLVHKALAPSVKLIDAVLGTNLSNCGDCGIREVKLNGITKHLCS